MGLSARRAAIAAIGGGSSNAASGSYATIGGGASNSAETEYAVIGGGRNNAVSDNGYTTVCDGGNNTASGYASFVRGGGGYSNTTVITNTAIGNWSVIVGGGNNTTSGDYATVGGGANNTASGFASSVGGGGGFANGIVVSNTASGGWSVIGGGRQNLAGGFAATVPGGSLNLAQGNYSLAARYRAKANHKGAFVWADSVNKDFASTAINEFAVRATGGINLVVGVDMLGKQTGGCSLSSNGFSWECKSDRNLKENLTAVDERDILARLNRVPIYTWNAIGQDPAVRHVGPMAQDFYSAFGLGDDDKSIATIDLDGVSLAAEQALYQITQEQAARISQLEAENAAQSQAISDLQKRMEALEQRSTSTGGSTPVGWLLGVGGLVVPGGVVVQRGLWKRRNTEEHRTSL